MIRTPGRTPRNTEGHWPMNHNDVARRTAHTLPARSLNPRTLACDADVPDRTAVRALWRPLPGRELIRVVEGGR